MRSRGNLIFTLVDREFYETIDRYQMNPKDYLEIVKEIVGKERRFGRNGIWMHCVSPNGAHPEQGWKIHVSATPKNAQEILKVVVPILHRTNTNFKFAIDSRILVLMNGKNWARGGAGKFITIYPPSTEDFLSLLEELHAATSSFSGPYILSDRRYPNSMIIHYRYGGLQSRDRFDIKGEKTPVIVSPEGEEVPDRRTPFFQLPPWASDPIQPVEPPETSVTLKNGRYTVEQALSFSNCGGVYQAIDSETGQKVIIKEARPYLGWTSLGNDAITLLEKEYRLLKKLEGTGVSPKPIDLFRDWEHLFLVEEFLEGMPLRSHSSVHSATLKTRLSKEDLDAFYVSYRSIFSALAKAVSVLHERGIVFGDLSPNNVIIDGETLRCSIIDFEAACEFGIDKPTHMFTPGFGTINDIADNKLNIEADYYALGAIMFSYLMPINGILSLKPTALKQLLALIDSDIGVPKDIQDAIVALTDKDAAARPTPASIAEILNKSAQGARASQALGHTPEEDLKKIVEDAGKYVLSIADPTRTDRLFPADPRVFTTNPLSISYGACGPLLALKHTGTEIPGNLVDWVLRQDLNSSVYPPGLFLGLSGIAWTLLDLELLDKAEAVLAQAHEHPLLEAGSDLFYGVAGWGLTNLRFFISTRREHYLNQAEVAANTLCRTAQKDENGRTYWPNGDEIPLGFGHGASGIALFLLYVYMATGNEKYLTVAESGLEFDLSHAVETQDGGLSWPYTTASSSIILPYWKSGSAGVGCTVLRFYRLFRNEHYLSILRKIHIDTDRKYSIMHGQFIGLAGIGHFLLDAYDLLKDEIYLKGARSIADSITLFAIEREQGTAFPDDSLTKISCDYANGSAGTMLFLNRLVTGKGFTIALDELFDFEPRVSGVKQPEVLVASGSER